ncbi:ATP-binding protein, partial [Nocardioides sp.]|uniref:ATP-binding protein n=1 Tax=Nocardioides sp. TaxID=35761 RepID=UPI00273535F4
MPVNREALPLGDGPRSVAQARRWVVSICRDLGREDLVESAELGVSELVTNALLHGSPPISVRVRGTWDHPRVEVYDGSATPPVVTQQIPDHDELLPTFGRGLDIVAMVSTAWGATRENAGKAVWFLPSEKPGDDGPPEGDLAGFELEGPSVAPPAEDDICRVKVQG